jgi:Domain of unknown function (DUF4249)
MKKFLVHIVVGAIVAIWSFSACKKNYNPPALQVNYSYLVINGGLISGTDSPSVVMLSRTAMLSDTTTSISPVTGATITAESDAGDKIPFSETSTGTYTAAPQLLDYNKKYSLTIVTSNGKTYRSDFVPARQTPPIDSLSWVQNGDVTVYAYTHDPANNTKYYRWDYVETYQYQAPLNAELSQDNGRLFYVDSTDQTYNCWRSVNSSNILVATTEALGSDVINREPIATVQQNSQEITVRYSILVKQYAITGACFNYLSVLKTNTENLGSIFDAQPTQLSGNFHCKENPSETVIGYFTASSVQQKRLFITKYQVNNWNFVDTNRSCDTIFIGHTPLPDPGFFVWDFPDTSYDPFYFCGAACLAITRRECVDCRLRGGTNQKPSYW